jgi:hypothetical protein
MWHACKGAELFQRRAVSDCLKALRLLVLVRHMFLFGFGLGELLAGVSDAIQDVVHIIVGRGETSNGVDGISAHVLDDRMQQRMSRFAGLLAGSRIDSQSKEESQHCPVAQPIRLGEADSG